MHAVVLAGGQGTRLRPYTAILPKPLLPLGARRPILGVILSRLAANGVRTVTLAVGTDLAVIRAYAGDGRRWGLTIDYAQEDEPLGTLGPLLPLLDRLPEQFLVVNGDVLTDLDFAALFAHHRNERSSLTVAVGERTTSVDFGVVESADGRITGFREKPTLRHDVNMGAYAVSRRALMPYRSGRPMGFDELISDLMHDGDPPAVFPWDGHWLDIGRPKDYERASREFTSPETTLAPACGTSAEITALRPDGELVRVLLLGGSGFIGRHVWRALAARPHVAVTTTGPRVGAAPYDPVGLDLVTDRISQLATLIDRIRPLAVVNCAGVTEGSIEELVAGNVVLVGNVIEAMRQADVGARLVHLGSAAEYGATAPTAAVSEADTPRPTSAYGMTKLVGTQLVTEATITGCLTATALRAFNVLGPGSPPASLAGRIVAEVHRATEAGGGIRLGRLDTVRDFVDVRDVAHAAVLAALGTCQLPEILNIGRGEPVVVRRLVHEVAQLAGFTGEVHEDGPIPPRSATIEWQCADIRRSREALGWEPSVSLRQSVTDLVRSTERIGSVARR
ncbi:MAG: NAD-dependent epimerase/dehydratase family protein [Pseudonocardiaceae bacterium]